MTGLGRIYLCTQDSQRPGSFECWVGDDRKPETPECDPRCGQYQQPDGYVAASEWADEMMVDHEQEQCPGCGLWSIWRPLPPMAVGDVVTGTRAVSAPVGTKLGAKSAAVAAVHTTGGWSVTEMNGEQDHEAHVRANEWVVLALGDGDQPRNCGRGPCADLDGHEGPCHV